MTDTSGRFNADELHAPQWLNEEFLTNILKDKKQDKAIKITKTVITPGTTKSDHYASIMFRAKLTYTTGNGDEKTISMIIKTVPILEGQKKDLLEKFDVFETEIKMYAETLPQIERIIKSHGDDTKLCADLLYYSLKPNKCIIFEDLCELGYTTISGRSPTIEEVKVAFLKLAKLHAVSYKLAKEGDTTITSFTQGMFNTDKNIMDFPIAANAITTIKEILAEVPDLAYFVPLFEKIEDKIFDKVFATFSAYQDGERDGILVLNHGDFHMKNMMIKKTGQHLDDLILLDYQLSTFTTAAVDIGYALTMLLSPEMRLNQRDEILYYYFTNFQKTLKNIEYQGSIPKLIDFQREILKHSHWDLYLFISWIIFNYVFVDEHGDLGKAVEDEEYQQKIFKSPAVIQEFRAILPKMLYQGYFDF